MLPGNAMAALGWAKSCAPSIWQSGLRAISLNMAIPANDLRIVIMRDTIHGEDHAVAAARLDGHWLTLDNRRMAMIEDSYVRNYRPLFVIGESGILQYHVP